MDKPKILAIDDEDNYTEIFEEYFSLRGYDIRVETDPRKAIGFIGNERFDVILVDLKMGGVSGQDILKKVRDTDDRTKVIIITAYILSGKSKQELYDLGAYSINSKPINSLEELENTVNKAYSGN
ncbi:MAG: response regulator [Candidatus Omnitrophica bacterium]|nr:response regulator [Candidatus Omnitrophota bacterium]